MHPQGLNVMTTTSIDFFLDLEAVNGRAQRGHSAKVGFFGFGGSI